MGLFVEKDHEEIRIVSSVFSPGDSARDKIYYRVDQNGRKRYRVYIYIEGIKLNMVRKVRYKLHPSFRKDIVTSKVTLENLNAFIRIWTWGKFEVSATIYMKDGEVVERTHFLDYDSELRANKQMLTLLER